MHNTHPCFYGATERSQASSQLYKSIINYAARAQPSRLMPATADERRADCGRKHFHLPEIPSASAGDRYPVLPSAALAVYLQLSTT